MFIWTKRSGQPGRMRFLWWPLLISLIVIVLVNVLINR
jgi:hypothetical protein